MPNYTRQQDLQTRSGLGEGTASDLVRKLLDEKNCHGQAIQTFIGHEN